MVPVSSKQARHVCPSALPAPTSLTRGRTPPTDFFLQRTLFLGTPAGPPQDQVPETTIRQINIKMHRDTPPLHLDLIACHPDHHRGSLAEEVGVLRVARHWTLCKVSAKAPRGPLMFSGEKSILLYDNSEQLPLPHGKLNDQGNGCLEHRVAPLVILNHHDWSA